MARDDLDPRVQQAIDEVTKELTREIHWMVAYAESPIEQLLGVYLHYVATFQGFTFMTGFWIEQQAEIKIAGHKYRVDFLLHLNHEDPANDPQIVVECDGHEFHERTKEQAARDKRRDRDLTAAGYKVFRFTGSEIWADPLKCANEIMDLAKVMIGR